jgi:hypothetical protein
MKKFGCLAPIMMAATDQGTILFTPDKLSDFANKVRLITASYGASAVVLILESWITKAKADEPLDTLTPPCESYDREEVAVIGQALDGKAVKEKGPTEVKQLLEDPATDWNKLFGEASVYRKLKDK